MKETPHQYAELPTKLNLHHFTRIPIKMSPHIYLLRRDIYFMIWLCGRRKSAYHCSRNNSLNWTQSRESCCVSKVFFDKGVMLNYSPGTNYNSAWGNRHGPSRYETNDIFACLDRFQQIINVKFETINLKSLLSEAKHSENYSLAPEKHIFWVFISLW